MTAREVTEAINAKLNDYFPQCAAGEIRKYDRFTIGNEWATVTADAQPTAGNPNRVRITAVLGEYAHPINMSEIDPDDIVTIHIRREASIRRATR